MILGNPQVYICITGAIQYARVSVAVHRLQLLAPKPHTRIGIIRIQLVLVEDVRAFLPASAGKELGVFVIAAGYNAEWTHEHVQRTALAVSGHLVIW